MEDTSQQQAAIEATVKKIRELYDEIMTRLIAEMPIGGTVGVMIAKTLISAIAQETPDPSDVILYLSVKGGLEQLIHSSTVGIALKGGHFSDERLQELVEEAKARRASNPNVNQERGESNPTG